MPACRNFYHSEIPLMLSGFSGRREVRDKTFFLLGLTTGFRASELCSLTIGDVTVAGKVRRTLTIARKRMKGRERSRTVPLLDEVRQHIGETIRDLNRRGFFAPDTRLFRMGRSHAYRILRACADNQGIRGNIGTHSLRKTFAHNIHQDFIARRAGGAYLDPLLETARALGHRAVQNTVAYLPESTALTHDAIVNLGRLLP